jgi:hypothetical protein
MLQGLCILRCVVFECGALLKLFQVMLLLYEPLELDGCITGVIRNKGCIARNEPWNGHILIAGSFREMLPRCDEACCSAGMFQGWHARGTFSHIKVHG